MAYPASKAHTWHISCYVKLPLSTVGQLRAKYAEILAMRLEHIAMEEGEAQGPGEALARERRVRAQMAALARRFPGALREVDDLELSEIRSRIHKLDALLAHSGEWEAWMGAVALFHQLTRGALGAKRWLSGRKKVDEAVMRDFSEAADTFAFPADAVVWADHLASIASPPGGRLTELVYAQMALKLGVTREEAKRLVFGVPRRQRVSSRSGGRGGTRGGGGRF